METRFRMLSSHIYSKHYLLLHSVLHSDSEKDIIAEVKENTSHSIQIEVDNLIDQYYLVKSFCNISSFNWRRVAYINMTDPEAECPSGLNETSNSTTGQRALTIFNVKLDSLLQ